MEIPAQGRDDTSRIIYFRTSLINILRIAYIKLSIVHFSSPIISLFKAHLYGIEKIIILFSVSEFSFLNSFSIFFSSPFNFTNSLFVSSHSKTLFCIQCNLFFKYLCILFVFLSHTSYTIITYIFKSYFLNQMV